MPRLLAFVLSLLVLAACATMTPAPPRNTYLDETNTIRHNYGAPPVFYESELERMAQDWANTLCYLGEFQHRDLAAVLNGPFESWNWLGENIGTGVRGATWDQMLHGWVNSPGHLANIVAGRAQAMGVGTIDCGLLTLWVVDFGDYRGT